MATAALVLGIIAIISGVLLAWIPFIGIPFAGIAVILGIVAVVLGIMARSRGIATGQATTGIVTGAIGAVVAIGVTVAWIVGVGMFASEMEGELDTFIEEAERELGEIEDLDDIDDGTTVTGPRFDDGSPPYTPYSGEDAPAFDDVRGETIDVGDLRFTDIEVLSDSFDDFLIRVDIENTGDAEGMYQVSARILDGDTQLGTVSGSGTLAPGEQAEAHLTGISDFDSSYDRVEFDVD